MEASEVEHIWRDSYVTKTSNGQFGHDDDDFGPETDVDAVHDVLSSGFPADAAKAKALVVQSQTMEEWQPQKFEPSQKEFLKTLPWTYADALKNPKPKSPGSDFSKSSPARSKEIIIYEVPEILDDSPTSEKIPKDEKSSEEPKLTETSEETKDVTTSEPKKKSEETGNDVAEAEVDSADDSEGEWNYIPGRNNKNTEKKQQVETPERPSNQAEEEDDMSQLNPNAAEFVPVFGAKVDTVLASSPAKGAEKSLEDIKVPKQKDFLEDISTKPGELDNIGYESSFNDTSVNGINVTVDSSKAESGSDSDQSEEADENDVEAPQSSNPFAGDQIQHQMVSDFFSESQSLAFKCYDPMQDSMVVLDSTPSPAIPAGADVDFLSNSDKPDLLSPIDNFSNTNNEQQKSSSSGFESESGNEIELGTVDKCDLVAGIPHDKNVVELPVIAQRVEEYPETNPFSVDNKTNEVDVEKSTEQSLLFGEDKFEPVSPKDPFTEGASPADDTNESKPLTISETESEKIEEPKIDLFNDVIPTPVDHVDLISGTVTADSNAAQIGESILEFTKNFEQSISESPQFEYGAVDVSQTNQTIPDDKLGEPKQVDDKLGEPKQVDDLIKTIKEQDDALNAVVDEICKDNSAESDGFEIISHDDANLDHMQKMNGGVHLDEEPSPGNYKFDELVQQQHTVEIHAEKFSFEPDFMYCDARPDSDVHSGTTGMETSHEVESSDEQIEAVGELMSDNVETTATSTVELEEDTTLVETKHVESKEEGMVDSVEETLLEPSKEEIIVESFSIEELEHEENVSPIDDASSEYKQIIIDEAQDDVKSPVEEVLVNDLIETALETNEDIFETRAGLVEMQESVPVTPSAPLSEDLLSDEVSNKDLLVELIIEEVPEDVEPKPLSQETPEEIAEEVHADDFCKQNGHIAEASTPPSTPAPGVEEDNKDGLIAAAVAVAAAGVTSVAAAATVVSGDAKPAKADDKTAKKPAAKPLSSARPSSAAKVPAKPGTASAAAKKPAAATKAPVSTAKTTAAKPLSATKPAAAKPTTAAMKPASPLTKSPASAAATKPKPTAAAKAPATKSAVGVKPPTPTTRTAPAVSKTAPLAKPKTPPTTTTTTATPAPIRRPVAGAVTKTITAAPAAAKKPEPSKPLASKTAPAARTTAAAPRPTSASKPTTTPTRPTSATKPAARPATSTTTKMAAPSSAPKPVGTTRPVAAKTPAATPASRTSMATKAAPVASRTAATKTAPPKPKPAAPTVLKKPAAADKTAKDASNKNAPRGPIKRPVDKTKVTDKDTKPVDKESEKIVEPPMQEPIVSTTNGHIDVIENGVSHSDESPIDVNPCPIVEAQN